MLNSQARGPHDGGVALASRTYAPDGRYGDLMVVRREDSGRVLVAMRSPGEASSTREVVMRSFATLDEAIAYVVAQIRERGGHFGIDDANGSMCLGLHGPLRIAHVQMLRRLIERRVASSEQHRFRMMRSVADLPYADELLEREGPVDARVLRASASIYRRKEVLHG